MSQSKSLAANPNLQRDVLADLAGLEAAAADAILRSPRLPVRRADVTATIRAGDGAVLELDADGNVSINGKMIGACEPDGVECFMRLAAEQVVSQ